MLARLRRRLTFANIIAVIALFFAMGGVAYAASIDGHSIIRHSTPGNRLVDNSVTGSQVRESSLTKVPKAAKADSATNAATANHRTLRTFHKVIATNTTTPRTVVVVGGLTIDLSCDASGNPAVRATGSFTGALIRGSNVNNAGAAGLFGSSNSTAGTPVAVFDATDIRGSVTGAYLTPAGHVVTFNLVIDDNNTVNNFDGCSVSGLAVSGPS